MKVTIDKRKSDVDGRTLEMAEKKLSRLDKYFDDSTEATVKFSDIRGKTVAEITVRTPLFVFRAEACDNDGSTAVDEAMDAISRQIRKNKTRLEKKLRDGALIREIEAEPVTEEPEMVRRKRFALKPMTEEEATLQMELLNHRFYLFKNVEEDNRICLVYLRDGGGYGIIEAE